MSSLVIGQVTSDGSKKAYNVHKRFINKFQSVDFLNEEYFNEFMKENVKEEQEVVFAPDDYGITIFDFKNKKVFSCNNYSGFLCFGTEIVCTDYRRLGFNRQEMIGFKDYKNNVVTGLSIYQTDVAMLSSPSIIHSALKHNCKIIVNGNALEIKKDDDYFSVAARIYGKDLFGLSQEDEMKEIRKSINEEDMGKIKISEYQNIEIEMPSWEFFNGDKSTVYLKEAYNYYNEQGILTSQEKEIWNDEIEDSEDIE